MRVTCMDSPAAALLLRPPPQKGEWVKKASGFHPLETAIPLKDAGTDALKPDAGTDRPTKQMLRQSRRHISSGFFAPLCFGENLFLEWSSRGRERRGGNVGNETGVMPHGRFPIERMVPHHQQRGWLPLYVLLGGVSIISMSINLYAARDMVLHHHRKPPSGREGGFAIAPPSEHLAFGHPSIAVTMPRHEIGSTSRGALSSWQGQQQQDTTLLSGAGVGSSASRDTRAAGESYSWTMSETDAKGGTVDGSPRGNAASSHQGGDLLETAPGGGAWMMVVVPTVKRKVSYLEPVLDALMQQVPSEAWDPLYGRIRVRVVNNDKGGHDDFRKAEAAMAGRYRGLLEFVQGNVKGSARWSGMTNVQR